MSVPLQDLITLTRDQVKTQDDLTTLPAVCFVSELDRLMVSQIERALAAPGIAFVVELASSTTTENELRAEVQIAVHESLMQNRGKSGTGKSALEWATLLHDALYDWPPSEIWLPFRDPTLAPGLKSEETIIWILTFTTRAVVAAS